MSLKDQCLGVSQRARGVIPSKVSDLENDLNYITEKDLEDIVLKNEKGGYEGLIKSDVRVDVDNLRRTIGVTLLKSISDDLMSLLPKKEGNYVDGTYLLKSTVSGGKPVFSFFNSDNIIKTTPYYYGNTSKDSDTIDAEEVKRLSNGGEGKENREYTFNSYKQRQVFAYPAEYGRLMDITLVEAGIDVIESFTLKEIWVGETLYYVYISLKPSTGEYTYRFIY